MNKACWRMSVVLLVTLVLCGAGLVPDALGAGAGARKSFGTVTGTVRDSRGNPLAGALVTLLRDGAAEVVRQTKSAPDGSFLARVAPGRYLLRAVADGFNSATFSSVTVGASDELVYRFNLEPAGQGRTTPERRPDRDDPKFRMRASQPRRSVFQIDEAEDSVVKATEVATADEATASGDEVSLRKGEEEKSGKGAHAPQGVVETFYTTSAIGGDSGKFALNFAVAQPVNENLELLLVGQTGALDRLEATARVRAGARHRFSATLGGARLSLFPKAANALGRDSLGQFSLRTIDEWVVRDGIVLVVGLDYSRFMGRHGKGSLTPRLGIQFDANARTRLRAAYAPGGRETRVQSAKMFEDMPVVFHEQLNEPVAVVDGKAVLERSRRLEFGVERVLDGSSSIEATAFLDTTDGRGVGLLSTPLNSFAGFAEGNGADFLSVANQQGGARGLRIVYTRRISNSLRASAGYAFGRGQQLAPATINLEGSNLSPDQIFQSGFFQTAAAQFDADVADGTRVRTVLRFSPRAAVFAIDPFAGRLAVYDPSLSIQVTQELPNFGLPLRAEAVLDARNLLDLMTCTDDGENLLSVANTRRTLRGGISVRF